LEVIETRSAKRVARKIKDTENAYHLFWEYIFLKTLPGCEESNVFACRATCYAPRATLTERRTGMKKYMKPAVVGSSNVHPC
jgi:hypothetical protein